MGRTVNVEKDYCRIARRYAEQVASGKIPACKWVRLACQRQLDDLKRKDREWHFDKKRAERVCRFIEWLPHVKGRWDKPTIELQPFQCFRFTTIFGWVDDEGLRRFRKVYIEEPRKNAKSTESAGVGLYLLAADGEPGAEVYSAATTRDQARISWDIAHSMARLSPDMLEHYGIEPLAHSIAIPRTGSMFKPLSRDADTLEGLNVHGAIIDELHAHKTREVFDVLNAATGSRRQPLIWQITTAGFNRAGVCYEQRDYVCKMLEGRHQDERYFGIIYTLDEADDWVARESWIKANPNFGVSVLEDDIASLCLQARASAQSQNNFLTKRLDLWVNAGTAFFNMLAWDSICKDEKLSPADFYGEPCWVGVDLASKLDISAVMQLFERNGSWYVFGRYYLPEERLERGNANYDYYRGWAEKGLLTMTPGNATDYEFIERDLMEDMANFDVIEADVDPWNAQQFSENLKKAGIQVVTVPQTVPQLSGPMKELEAAVISGKIKHNGDPVLAWMMSNVEAKVDAKENVYPRKARPENKIDGPVAILTAMSRALVAEPSYAGCPVVVI